MALLFHLSEPVHVTCIELTTPVLNFPHFREMYVETSAYTIGDPHTPGVIMANGEKAHEGAVAYNDVPLGTVIYIDEQRYIVKDRCGRDGVVDIYMNSYAACIQYGRQIRKISIMED